MKKTNIHKDYQVNIPDEIIETLNISLDDTLTWEIEEDKIIIKVNKQRKLKNKQLSFVADEEIELKKI